MALSNELAKLFAKTTNDNKTTSTETTVYGTIVENDGTTFVKIDGSEVLTPVKTTASVKNGDRVTVMLKNHTAMVTGNITAPSASSSDVDRLASKVDQFEIVVADVVTTEELQAEVARIDTVVADNVTIHEKLTAMEADIGEITAGEVTTEQLNAVKADIETLQTNKLDAATADIKYAKISELDAAKADISELEADNVTIKQNLTAAEANIKTLTANDATINGKLTAAEADIDTLQANDVTINNKLTAAEADIDTLQANDVTINNKLTAAEAAIDKLEANQIDTEYLEAHYANIDFSNIGEAAMEKFYADSGLIKNVQIGDATITGELVGVTISGDLIKGNTIVAEKLVIKGEDGLYYKLNTDGMTTEAQQTDYNSLNGSLIQAQSITATKISVDDLVAFDATIGGFNISETSLYSGVKSSVANETTGVFMDKTGQFNVGDGLNFLKYYKDTNGKYRLEVSADSILFGTNKRSIEDIEVTSTAEGAPVYITDGTDANAIDISVDGEMSQTTIAGNQLLDYTKWCTGSVTRGTVVYENNGITITATGDDAYTNYSENSVWAIPIAEGETITISWEEDTNATGIIYLFPCGTSGAPYKHANNAIAKQISYTAVSGDTHIVFRFGVTKSGTTISYKNIMVNKGNTALPYEPYCGGISSPNPDYTQAIKATGDCGWFDGELLQGYYATNGSVTSYDGRVAAKNLIPCNAGDKINLIYEEVVSTLIIAFFKDNVWLSQVTANNVSELNGTVPSGANSFGISMNNTGITPSTAKHITVTINGKYALIVKSGNKNIFDVSKIANATGLVNNNGVLTFTDTYTVITSVTLSGLADLTVGETYTLSFKTTGAKNFIYLRGTQTEWNNGTSLTITQEMLDGKINLYGVTSGTSIISEIQIEPGTVATDYVPHQSHREYIPLDEPLREDDSIICQNGVYGVERYDVELIYDSSTVPSTHISYPSGCTNLIWINAYHMAGLEPIACTMATKHPIQNVSENQSANNYLKDGYFSKRYGGSAGQEDRIYIKSSKFTSVDDVIAYIAESPFKLLCKRDTPTFTPFEDQTPFYRIKTFNNVTHISASDNANVKVTYYRNTDDGQNLANIKFLGDVIVEGSITTDQLNTDEIFANDAVLETLTAQEAFINAISTNSVVVGANNTATNAQSTANTANTNASNAVTTANTANTNAATALSTANTAKTTADTASSTATAAQSTANTANTNASNAVSTANSAKTTANAAQTTANANASTIANWCYNNDVTYINGGKIYTGSITADKIDVTDLFAQDITATGTITGAKLIGAEAEIVEGSIGKLSIDADGRLVTTVRISDEVVEENTSLFDNIDDYINIDYSYSATHLESLKNVVGTTSLGISDMAFSKENTYANPDTTYALLTGSYTFPIISDVVNVSYSQSGISYNKTFNGYIEGLGSYSDEATGSIEFIDVLAGKNIWARCNINFDYTGVNNLEVDSDLDVTGSTILGSTLNVTGATTLSSTLSVTGASTLKSTLSVSGAATFASPVTISHTGDASGTAAGSPALIIGTATGAHMAFDVNEIICKSNATTPAVLVLNNDGGGVQLGSITTSNGGYQNTIWGGTTFKNSIVTDVSLSVGTTATIGSTLTVNGPAVFKGGLELYHSTPFIDFHYGNSTADYTMRMIASATNVLDLAGSFRPGATITYNLGASDRKWSNTYTYMLYYTSQSQSSDKRLKKDISDIDDKYLELWDLINPQKFKFIDQDKYSLGIIAQELEESMSEVGLTENDCAFLNKQWIETEDYTGYEYGVDYTFINILNLCKMKEMAKEIKELKAIVNSLTA